MGFVRVSLLLDDIVLKFFVADRRTPAILGIGHFIQQFPVAVIDLGCGELACLSLIRWRKIAVDERPGSYSAREGRADAGNEHDQDAKHHCNKRA